MEQRMQTTWEPLALTAVAVAGLAIAIYLTATHSNALLLICSLNSVVNCASVVATFVLAQLRLQRA